MVKGLEARVQAYGKPPAAAPEAPKADAKPAPEQERITQPLKEDNIVVSTPQKQNFQAEVERAIGQAALDRNQESWLSPLTKKAGDGREGEAGYTRA